MQAIKVSFQDIFYNSKHSVHQDFLTKAWEMWVRGRNQSDGEIKLYDHEAQKVASILKKSRNPNLFDGHTNKGRRRNRNSP
jgi:hypothetical protein